MSKPTTATFWSSAAREPITKVLLISLGPDTPASGIVDRLKDRGVSVVYYAGETETVEALVAELSVDVERIDPATFVETIVAGRSGASVAVILSPEKSSQLISKWLGLTPDGDCYVLQSSWAVNSIVLHGNRVVLETVNDVCHIRPRV